jgi:hypothetical protein
MWTQFMSSTASSAERHVLMIARRMAETPLNL